MSTSRKKLQQARELIQAKRYDEARALLRTIDHEMALDWIDKIDKLDPPKVAQTVKSSQRGSWLPILFLAVVILAIAGIFFYQSVITPMSNHIQQTVDAINHQAVYCSTYCKAINGDALCIDDCYKGTATPKP